MSVPFLYLLFFLSGISGLIYQVIWVREFGNVFGNTVYSTSIVIAIFMLGLGVGSYVVGIWSDRRYLAAPESLLRTYGYIELIIAALGLTISLLLPALGVLSAALSGYTTDSAGWWTLSPLSYAARAVIAVVLLSPITLLMGGTLTLLIRYLVRGNVVDAGGWTIALLYGVNTLGAALGAFITDFSLVPSQGLGTTQLVAVALNAVAGVGALYLASPREADVARSTQRARKGKRGHVTEAAPRIGGPGLDHVSQESVPSRAPLWTSVAIALSGFAAMGMEILWLRHFNLLLGGFRAVFSLLITVVLVGMGVGALAGGLIARRTTAPARVLMLVQALFAATSLAGIAFADVTALRDSVLVSEFASLSPWRRSVVEFWYSARPMLWEVLPPALFMGCAFPLANAVIQRAELVVGRRAGLLYLANTAGAVVGSLTAGYLLLPLLGIQGSATMLAAAAAGAILPLYFVDRAWSEDAASPAQGRLLPAGAAVLAVAALGAWLTLPANLILDRSRPPLAEGERIINVSEGVTEIIAVTEIEGRGRGLITNGHPMSSTARLDQRYMRALAHVPLLLMEAPERVLVIGFGVGNTTHAATLHPSVRQVDVADLSRHVLEHSSYFRDTHGGVLEEPRVEVFVNDGRQHLLMQPEATYDLVTLEPPPIAYAGVGALYSREFYELTRSRLKPGGYLTQWLPIYQVPPATGLAMIRAFLDVFPQTVLLSGSQAELLLVGTTAPSNQIDPARLQRAIDRAPDVKADLGRIDLGTVTEIVGMFVASSRTLALATRDIAPVTDDRPLQEYGLRSTLGTSLFGVPAVVIDLASVTDWCPTCLGEEGTSVGGLDTYLALMYEAYHSDPAALEVMARSLPDRRVLGSRYLGAVVPESAAVYDAIGTGLLRAGRADEAREQFEHALRLDPGSAETRQRIGAAEHEAGARLMQEGRFDAAVERLRAALAITPDSAPVHNDLGIALASQGDLVEATQHFQRAVELEPGFVEAQQNLEAARSKRR